MKWFEVKVKYIKTNDEGVQVKVTDAFLIEAESFADAEGRVAELGVCPSSDYEVDAVKKNKVSEIFRGNGKWYLACIALVALVEKTGAEKASVIRCYVCAEDFDGAVASVKENMRETMSDWYIVSLSESGIIDVYENKE